MAQLYFLRQKKINKRNRVLRKERNKQLVAFGVLVENAFKAVSADDQQEIIDSAHELLTGRNLGLALEGFTRLTKARTRKAKG